MRYAIYRTMTKSHKNRVTLSRDSEKDIYYVSYVLWGKSEIFKYTHYNHATYKFDLIHKFIVENFKDIVTNVK